MNAERSTLPRRSGRSTTPDWYKDAVIYELRTRSFFDGNDDGIGDFEGLTRKLDYLQDLGVDTLWLLPFYPSPLRDDGYDISGYTEVHPDVGTLKDFKTFLKEAHRRGLRVVTELVLNHTSDQHPWFQQARNAPPGSAKRDFYVWSDSPERFSDARVIFKDFEASNWTWDPKAKAYFWHRFYSHQPDLNYDNPRVRKAMLKVVDFWLSMGVDGLRLDAVPYLFEREGTNCENLPEVHEFLSELRRHIDSKYPNRMLLAEANQWPEDAAAYFGDGDECHMAFHFPIMPRLFMAAQMEDRFPIVDILHQTPDIAESAQWALFLRNHDELTLEMVTDEERDYMYRVYAREHAARINLGIRRRLAPLLENDRRKIELMNALLLSMPGTPVLYYGDEIGMGDNFYLGDRNGVRTPMQWNSDRNAGFSRANPHKLLLPVVIDPEYHYETVNVEAQQRNSSSLLWWTKRLIGLRKSHPAFGRGSLEIVGCENQRVLAFCREWDDERVLVVCNLSRFPQSAELDLSKWHGTVPVELFGGTEFPRVRKRRYAMTLGPYSFYWFSLERSETEPVEVGSDPRVLNVKASWREILDGESRTALEALLPEYLARKRWFGGKARQMESVRLADALSLNGHSARLCLLDVRYADDTAERYLAPLDFATGEKAVSLASRAPEAILATVRVADSGEQGPLFDATVDPELGKALLDAIARGRKAKGRSAAARGRKMRGLAPLSPSGRQGDEALNDVVVASGEQSNTTVRFDESFVLKLFRKIPEGVSPELELGRALSAPPRFEATPALSGWIELTEPRDAPPTLAVLHRFVRSEGDAWRLTLDWLGRYYDRVLSRAPDEPIPPAVLESAARAGGPGKGAGADSDSASASDSDSDSDFVGEWLGGYLEWVRLMAVRTAELHRALGAESNGAAFEPERFSKLYQRSLYQSMRNLTGQVMRLVRQRARKLPARLRKKALELEKKEGQLVAHFHDVMSRRIGGLRVRCHGDYHLGQLLFTGKDFCILDFEGEPARPVSERRIKRSPLRDVAGMVRSFHYAAYAALPGFTRQGAARSSDLPRLEPWARFWNRQVSAAFVETYVEKQSDSNLLPDSRAEVDLLLDVLALEKAVYEVGYELNNRPAWSVIPLAAISERLSRAEGAEEKELRK